MTWIGNLLSTIQATFARLAVPTANSINNVTESDVIGNKTDTIAGTSAMSLLKVAAAYIHAQSRVYPTLADGVVVTGDNVTWTLGAYSVIIPANAVDTPFIIDMIDLQAFSAIDTYELVLYYGPNGAEVEAGRIRFTRTTNNPGPNEFQTEIIPANSQIKAKLATKNGLSATVTISLNYHRC